jgi:F-type H+-transporting ATPase subunit c
VNKFAKISALAAGLVLFLAVQVFAQDGAAGAAATQSALISFSGAFGVGLTVIGAAYGIGKLASAALESMARQPEVAGSIQTAMIIAAALIEGFTFYALFICSNAAVNRI